MTEVDNSAAQGCGEWNTAGGNNTQDRIFLLSWAEASRYFGAIELEKENVQARTEPTAYAVSRGAVPNSKDKTENGADAVPWWLRSPGMNQMSAICVYNDGSMVFGNVIGGHTCVRPALWIDPESEIFKSENPRD